MRNIAGSPVEGSDFFGREADVQRLREILDRDDILLLGPRRIGKTSIARAVQRKVREEGWKSIEVNVASCSNEREFLDKLYGQLKPEIASFTQKATSAIGNTLSAMAGRIKSAKLSVSGIGLETSLGTGASEDWAKVANDLLQLIRQVEEPWLIYVDELPIMLFNFIRNDPQSGVQRVRRFMDWLRNDVRALPGSGTMRWLVSGSVGLDTLVQEQGMADTINSMQHEKLEPFSHETANAMLLALAKTYDFPLSSANAQRIVDEVQWLQPYYLQLAFNHLRNLARSSPEANLDALVSAAVDRLALPGEDNDFHHWEKRLELQLSPSDAKHAQALLTIVAHSPNGVGPALLLEELQTRLGSADVETVKKTFIRLRDILEKDAYWWADESSGARCYRFHLEPLRRWWVRRDTL